MAGTPRFAKLPSVALPKTNIGLTTLPRFNVSTPRINSPKASSFKAPKAFNFGSLKGPKLPKAPKLAIMKSAIKKVTNKGF